MAVRLGDLAERIGAELHGDPDCEVARLAPLERAEAGDVSFLYDRRYRNFLKITGASAVILGCGDREACSVAALVHEDPYLGYVKAAALLHPEIRLDPGIHPSACIGSGAEIDPTAYIGPYAVVGERVWIGAYTLIGPGSIIEPEVRIGDYTRLVAQVTVLRGTTLGRRCIIHPGAVIGADGFGFARDQGRWLKIPHLGGVRLGDDVEIGANTTIDRGALKDTVIEDGVKLDNQVQIGHNVHVGAHTAIAGCAGIAGGARIGKRCIIGGGAGIAGYLEIADDVVVNGMTVVTKSISAPGTYSSVWPARESGVWKKKVAGFNRGVHFALKSADNNS
jgi:UDP-3-O-[3-hydroxymyristoyl] glucosamine N-acyltransferase